MRHVVETIVRVPLSVPVAPLQRPPADGRTVHELCEDVLGVPGSVLKVWPALDERHCVAAKPVLIRQFRPNVWWHAVAEDVESPLDAAAFEFWYRHSVDHAV